MPRPPIDLRYSEHGVGGAGPIVLLHGFPLNRAMWDEQVASLADRYHLIVPDLRGHGETDAPDGPYEMADHAGDVLALLDRLGHQRAAVVGLSMGGYILLQLMTRAPERLSAVVLADTMGEADAPERKQARADQAEVIRSLGLGAFADLVLPRMFGPTVPADRPHLVERFRQTILSQQPEAVVAALQGLAARPDMMAALPGVKLPTLVVVGSDDMATTSGHAHNLAAAIPGATLVVLPGAGHMSNWEDPDGFNRAVRLFLDRTLSPG
ncbi:MAG: alpha/beta fold hydrolase [Chloroflexi bacterium]|nr:alpha/beta fold hydrolase [Chloroflexota bacterium]